MILKKIKSEVLVGLLTLIGVAGIIYTSVTVTGGGFSKKKSYPLKATFENVSGLSEKTAVRLSGIQVGEVEQIFLDNRKAVVIISIYEQYTIPIDSKIQIRTLGLLGDKYLEIIAGEESIFLQHNQTISTDKAQSLDELIAGVSGLTSSLQNLVQRNEKSFDEIIENIRKVSASLQRITSQNEKKLNNIIENIDKTTVSLRKIIENNEEKINQLIDNANETTASLRRITMKNEDNINEIMANLKQFSVELKDIADASSLQNSISNIESITEKINDGDGTLAQLVNESDTIEKIDKALDDISNLLGPAARWKYDVRFQTKYLTNRDQYASDFRFTIYTQKDRFYNITLYDSPRGRRTSEITTTSNDTTKNTTYETKITDDYLIGLQIGKRFYDTQFRIGFFESTFGIGVDQFLGVKDQWQLTSEIFDFSRNEGAFFSLGGVYRYKALQFHLGAYDILNENSDNQSISIGFGLEFNEDDLRVLGASTITSGLGR